MNSSGVVTGITITNAGSGYSIASPPTITIDSPGGSGTTATATATFSTGGAGYLSPPLVTLTGGGGGSGATATAVLTSGVVTAITISGGSGYTSAPTITIAPPLDTATGTATLSGGTVGSIAVTYGGNGYSSTNPPVVTLNGGNFSSPATATAVVTNGVVTAINVTGGAGYSTAPSVTIASPIGAGALSVSYASPATTGTLTYTPVPFAFGTATITVTVTNSGGGNNTTTQTFLVTVNPVNEAPTISPIISPAPILENNSAVQTVNLSGITAGPGQSEVLTVTAASSNPGLIPNPTVSYISPNTVGTLTYTAVPNASGTAVISVTVMNNGPRRRRQRQRGDPELHRGGHACQPGAHAEPDPEPRRSPAERRAADDSAHRHQHRPRRPGTDDHVDCRHRQHRERHGDAQRRHSGVDRGHLRRRRLRERRRWSLSPAAASPPPRRRPPR